jgi:rod shape-determining protein MreC
VPPYAGPSASRSGDIADTLRLLAYLTLAVVLIVLDHRGGWLSRARQQAQALTQPIRAVAGLPGRVVEAVSNDAGTLSQLTAENRRLRNELLVTRARMARLATVNADNARLRGLLGASEQGSLDVQLAPVLDIDLDPTRQRLVLSAGSGDGVRIGQSVIDAGGLVGQIIEVGPLQSTVLLLTDPDHAIPVAIARNGVRLIAYGTGRADQLALASVPLSSDVKVGDVLVTSGLGGRFAAGFPVGTITALRPDESRAFLVGDVKPAAELDRGRDMLLLRTLPPRPVIGPQAPGVAAPGSQADVAGGANSPATQPAASATASNTTNSTSSRKDPARAAATSPPGQVPPSTQQARPQQATPPVNGTSKPQQAPASPVQEER